VNKLNFIIIEKVPAHNMPISLRRMPVIEISY